MSEKQDREQSGSTAVAEISGSLKVTPTTPAKGEVGNRSLYWIGALSECPLDNPTAGGVSFVKTKKTFTKNGRGQMVPTGQVPGDLVPLHESQVRDILKAVAGTVIRVLTDSEGVMTQAHKLSVNSVTYAQEPRDTPLAQYVYMKKVQGDHREPVIPDPMFTPGVDS